MLSPSAIASIPHVRLELILDQIISQLPTKAPIYLPTNRISLRDQVTGLLRVSDIYKNKLDTLYRPHLRALKECYEGHDRCFVIGNGPSLNRTDLSVLKDEVTFAVNGFFLKSSSLDWTPTFYVVEDHLVAEDRRAQINAFKGPIKLFPAYLGYCFEEGPDTIFYNHRPRKSWPDGFDFSTDAAEITYTGCTVTFSCLQLAYYLGFRTIYLIGVDSDYAIPADAEQKKDYGTGVLDMKSDDPNHFHPDYFGKGYRWHDPQVDKMLEAYAEARRVADLNGRRIVNATVGGRLEVFEREAFSTIFPKARGSEAMEAINARELAAREQAPEIPDARPQEPVTELPRLLVFDLTKRGNGTATGELKSTLFSGWPQDRYLQFYSGGIHQVAMDPDEPSEGSKVIAHDQAQVLLRARRFAPQVILYRPVPNNPALHEAAMHVIRSLDVPLVVWIMDDWPSRLAAEDPKTHAALDADLRELLDRAVLRLSICDAMSDAFEARYGVPFKAFANGIDPADWPAATGDRPEGPFLIRYAGSLAQDMTVDSVERVARVVERMGEEGIDVRLEIRTQATWHTRESHRFKGLKRTGLTSESLDREAYRAWLSEADALLMAYNFDEASKRYIRYSLANKLPECLVSGAAVLAHGPGEVATMAYLQAQDCACIVDEPDPDALARAIAGLVHDGEYRRRLSERARACAVARHNVHDIRRTLQHEISLVAGNDSTEVISMPPARSDELDFSFVRDLCNPVGSNTVSSSLFLCVCSNYALILKKEFVIEARNCAVIGDAINHAKNRLGPGHPVVTNYDKIIRHIDTPLVD